MTTHKINAQPISVSQFKINAEARVRAEGSNNRDFTNSIEDKDNFVGSRFRVGIDFQPSDATNIFMQFQYSKSCID